VVVGWRAEAAPCRALLSILIVILSLLGVGVGVGVVGGGQPSKKNIPE
jgi:VIT1/CCC1 family predicted Fe2+/Mn2+ transporter